MKTSSKSAFTLIELLVVIAIIAILAGLAMTQMGPALERARALSDSNQLRSLGQLYERYLSDHDDALPTLTGSSTSWPADFHKITPDYKIFLSPFDKRPVTDGASSPVSYGINNSAFGLDRWEIISPSEFFMMAPVATVGTNRKPIFSGTASSNVSFQAGNTHGIYKITNTGSMLNVLFADWHIAPMNYSDFSDTNSTAGMKHWLPKYEQP